MGVAEVDGQGTCGHGGTAGVASWHEGGKVRSVARLEAARRMLEHTSVTLSGRGGG